jgi:nitrogen fixation/metabolism regulation signal transduction histidine kinase
MADESMARGLKLTLVLGAAAMAGIGVVLLLLLTQATNNQALYEQNYPRLMAVNVGVAVLLLLVLGWIALRLGLRLRKGKFGSRFLIKLAMTLALVGLLPGILIYTVSYQFVSRSIESWFDVKVEGALDAGLNLGRQSLDALAADIANKTRLAAVSVGDTDLVSASALERVREQLGASDVVVWSSNVQALASVGASRYSLQPERPTPSMVRMARSQRVVTQFEGLDDLPNEASSSGQAARVRALATMPGTSGLGLSPEVRYLQVTVALPPLLVRNATAVQDAYREYQERALARQGLKRMYIGTLTLSLFMSVFGAVLLSVLLGNQIVRPLLLLADGVRQVAEGDLSPKAAFASRDELGGLTRSFAEMTQQLADARQQVQASVEELSDARERLQTILDNQSAGVMVLGPAGQLRMINAGATRVLRQPLAAHIGQRLEEVAGLAPFGQWVQTQFHRFEAERTEHEQEQWQQAVSLMRTGELAANADGGDVHWVVRGAPLGTGIDDQAEHLVVVDDISEIVSAQRAQAWGEVARRLAHEIKNPLTPIQLSAERLGMKLAGKLQPTEQALLDKSVGTIVDQVDAMKRLVNEFRDYARLPAAQLKPTDLNAVVREVLQLYPEDSRTLNIRLDLDDAAPPIIADAQQLRQVIHNLVQNAQEACEPIAEHDTREVLLRTKWVEPTQSVRLIVRDQGPGFAQHLLKRAFEPYVTTKIRGTGLGLPVVKKIADEHGARIDLSNRVEDGKVTGAVVSVAFRVAL